MAVIVWGTRVQYRNVLYRRFLGSARRWESWKETYPPDGDDEWKEGLYIGYRTLCNGHVRWEGDEIGNVFLANEYFEAYLIVPSPRHNPVYVRPEDVRPLTNSRGERIAPAPDAE